jgi:hypothetical protein
VKRIKYVSQFAVHWSRGDVEALVSLAAQRNAAASITGILMTCGGIFFQVIEGPRDQVERLFTQIQADPRHREVLVLDVEEAVTSRHFPDWAMKRFDLGAEADTRLAQVRALLTTLVARRLETERLTNALERAIWNELAATQHTDPG